MFSCSSLNQLSNFFTSCICKAVIKISETSNQYSSYIVHTAQTKALWFLPRDIKYIGCTEVGVGAQVVSASFPSLKPFLNLHLIGSCHRSPLMCCPCPSSTCLWYESFCHYLGDFWGLASQSWKPAGAFDLRPLFSPNTFPPEEKEKALIYVLLFNCATVRSQPSSVLKHGGEVVL